MNDPQAFQVFRALVGDDAADGILERICLLPDPNHSREGFTLVDVHTHNACNHTMTGWVEVNGAEYAFEVSNGDWAGTVIHGWAGENDAPLAPYEPPKPDPMTIAPRGEARFKPLAWKIRDLFVTRPDVIEKLRSYNYDRHFAPGHKTEAYYRAWALSIKADLVPQSVVDDWRTTARLTGGAK